MQLNEVQTTIVHMQTLLSTSLIQEIGPKLYRYFQHKGAGNYTSDLVQETLIRLFDKYEKFDDTKGSLLSFSFGFAHHIWQEHLRYFYKHHEPIDELSEDLPTNIDMHQELEKVDYSEKLKVIISRFPKLHQDILYFYFDEELTTKHISQILSIPEGTVKSHLHRTKEQLKSILAKDNL